MKKNLTFTVIMAFNLVAPGFSKAQTKASICRLLGGQSTVLSDGSGVAEICTFSDGINGKSEIDAESLKKYFNGKTTTAVSAFLRKASPTALRQASNRECLMVEPTALLLSIPDGRAQRIFHLCLFKDGSLISPDTLARGPYSQTLRLVFNKKI